MKQVPPDWIKNRQSAGRLQLAGVTLAVDYDEGVLMEERMAICVIDGELREDDADRIVLREWRERHGIKQPEVNYG